MFGSRAGHVGHPRHQFVFSPFRVQSLGLDNRVADISGIQVDRELDRLLGESGKLRRS